ncbi:MAG: DUF4157 domain-containing protein [Jatrophihabitantaceae bacterium]
MADGQVHGAAQVVRGIAAVVPVAGLACSSRDRSHGVAGVADGEAGPTVQRQLAVLRRRAAEADGARSGGAEAAHPDGALLAGRTGLPADLKAGMEALSGYSLDDVRVHYNSSKPTALNALAYTHGSDIHLGPGQENQLAHEAWHVVQQKQGRVRATAPGGVNDELALEREADTMSRRAESSGAPRVRDKQPLKDAAATGAVIQLRGANPYGLGGGITSHHVIPHSLLVAARGLLPAADQTDAQGRLLPAWASLTAENLIKASIEDMQNNPLQLAYNGQNRTVSNIERDQPAGWQQVARTKFADLSVAEQGMLTFDGAPFATFQARYGALRAAANTVAGGLSEKEQNLLDTFYEWQSGNQFYGAARYEPGTSNDFDADAQHVLGEDYTAQLKAINTKLLGFQATAAGNGGALLPADQLRLKAVLLELAALGSPGRVIPDDNNADWSSLNSDEKQHALTVIERYDRVAASGAAGPRDNTKKVHKGIIRRGMSKVKVPTKAAQVHDIFTALKSSQKTSVAHPLMAEWQVSVEKAKLSLLGRSATTVINVTGLSMATVAGALDDLFVQEMTPLWGL